MRIMLLGHTGQVGWELARSLMPLGEVVAPDRQACDLSRPERLDGLIAEVAPEVIVNAAAYTAVDKAETEEALAERINAEAVGELARAARKMGALFVHYSTEHVFDGTRTTPYLETDPVSPLNAYGRSKRAGELATLTSGSDYLIFRTTWVYAARGRNFLRTLLRLGQEREQIQMVDDQIGAPTWARNLADATAHAIRQAMMERRRATFESGIFHMANAGQTSWYRFAEAIFADAEQFLPHMEWRLKRLEAISTAEYPVAARRPANSRLSQEKLLLRFGLGLPPWADALRYCLQEMAEQKR